MGKHFYLNFAIFFFAEGQVYTELSLNPVDFTEYAIETDGELTFPLREFKTFTSFAETMKLPVSIYFISATQ